MSGTAKVLRYTKRVNTKIRMGKFHYMLKAQKKGDPRKWSVIAPVILDANTSRITCGIVKDRQEVIPDKVYGFLNFSMEEEAS